MAEEQAKSTPPVAGPRWRRGLWDDVLPEGLGLCFVAVIVAGLAAGYLAADQAWQREAEAARRSEAALLAQTWAVAIAAQDSADEHTLDALVRNFAPAGKRFALRWTDAGGQVRWSWPRALPLLASSPGTDPRFSAAAGVTAASGEARGQVTVELDAPRTTAYRLALLTGWAGVSGLTLLAFTVLYRRLRKHLRPLAAIGRNLARCAAAATADQELRALTLSDTLGGMAHGWNALLAQLANLRRQLQSVNGSAQSDVLARFEGTVYRRIIDRLPFGVLCVGEQGEITYANASAAALLSRPTAELTTRSAAEVIENPAVVQAVAAAQTRAGAGVTVDHTTRSGDQETTLRFRVLRTGSPGSGEVLVTVEDVSQLREGERTRDSFLYHVTHELRTPLTNIHAYAETLTQPGFDDEQTRKECYNVIISETRRLSELVENILSISQLEVGTARLNVGEIDLVRLLRQMVQDNLGGADEKRIDLTLALPPKVPKVQGDKQRLAVLLNNLIGNAVKYTPKNGKVHVKLEVQEQRLRIAITDTGIGIKPDDQARVFDKFYRAADEAVQAISGTGLGLALAREVARLHGGDIYVESAWGKGSTFTVELPLAANESASPAGLSAEVPTR